MKSIGISNNKDKYVEYALIAIPFVFYLFFSLFDGAIWCGDTYDYVYLTGRREPLYPSIVNLFRIICFNNEIYKILLIIFQGFLLAYSIYNFVSFLRKELKLNNNLSLVLEFVFLSISLFCRFAAKRGSMYSNCILSEGVIIPLFILFFRYAFEYLISNSRESFIKCLIYLFFLIFGRKQMFFALGLFLLIIFYQFIIDRKAKKFFLKLILCILIVLGSRAIDTVYMNLVLDVNSTHTSDNRFITTMIFYTADREDGELIEDKEVRVMFYEIYDECKANGYLKDYSLAKWHDRVEQFTKNYDNIQIKTMCRVFKEHATSVTSINYEVLVDEYNSKVISTLLVEELPEILKTLVDSYFAGLMITVSADKDIFLIYAIIVYVLYIALLIYGIKKRKLDKVNLFALLTLLSILLNVLIVSAVIFNQTRYTIYNMPLFYIAGLLMLYNLFIDKKKVNSYEENK